jgi:activator of HSP90 ATPase
MAPYIRQDVTIAASAKRIYQALLDPRQFSAFTGAGTEIDAIPGGAFSCFGGMIIGRNIELVAERRIVQAWRAANWPGGVYSLVRFDLEASGPETKLTLQHIGFPEDAGDHLASGWHKMYWEPLKTYLRGG